ncbi:cheW protein [Firmicutes bacterium CAG:882]|jgi:purine-binding chemotaxis protein CheW|nr:cheW protein [Firmicutes bacterium CAG:882]
MDAITTSQSTARQYIVIKLGEEQYGININYIDNIVRMQKITRVPKAQHYFKGVINLRGEIVPVMSLRLKFGLPVDEITDKTRIIIIKLEQQATVGLIVDQVNEVVTLDEDSVEKTAIDANNDMAGYISAIGKSKGELISLLNIQLAIADKEQAREE